MTPPHDLDVDELVQRARAGDRAALERLLAAHRDRLRDRVRLRIGPGLKGGVEADDVVQDVFLTAVESLARFEWRGSDSFFRWLCGIAENRILDLADRHRRKRQLSLDRDVDANGDSPSVELRRDERFDRLEASLARLGEDHRRVIVLARIEGLPLTDVAARMHRSPNATAQLLWRALQKLRETFGDTESFRLPPRRLAAEVNDDD